MSNKVELDPARVATQRDMFAGIKGRLPKSDKELKEWLATDEGKAATLFEPTPVAQWGAIGRS